MTRANPRLQLVATLVIGWISTGISFGDVILNCRIIDADTNAPVAARIYLQHESGSWHFPKSAASDGSAVEYRRQRTPATLEMHTTLSAHPFTASVPPGKLTITVERGKEYIPVVKVIDAPDGVTVDVELPMRRWIHLAQRGWYSGDTHIHRSLAEMPNVILAEDLNIAFPMSHWVQEAYATPMQPNRVTDPAPPPKEIVVAPDHLIYPLNTEYEIFKVDDKPHTLGAFLVLGQRTVFDRGVPPVGSIAEQAHAEGALIDLEKHSWPWSAAIVPVMNVDLYELSNNHVWRTEFGFPKWTLEAAPEHMQLERDEQGFTEWGWIEFGFKTYYALLNCGLKLKPCAGTASGVHPVPAGFGRVYVHQPDGFGYENWMAGLKAGRSFVTNGPMLDVRFNQEFPGHEFSASDSFRCQVTGTAESLSPLDRIEIIVNGRIVDTVAPRNRRRDAGGYVNNFAVERTFDRSGWVTVRCFEQHPQGRIRFAHTGPAYVAIEGKPLRPRTADVNYFIEMVQRELKRNADVLPDAALDEYRKALQFYESKLSDAE
jgi:hypothetical protein